MNEKDLKKRIRHVERSFNHCMNSTSFSSRDAPPAGIIADMTGALREYRIQLEKIQSKRKVRRLRYGHI